MCAWSRETLAYDHQSPYNRLLFAAEIFWHEGFYRSILAWNDSPIVFHFMWSYIKINWIGHQIRFGLSYILNSFQLHGAMQRISWITTDFRSHRQISRDKYLDTNIDTKKLPLWSPDPRQTFVWSLTGEKIQFFLAILINCNTFQFLKRKKVEFWYVFTRFMWRAIKIWTKCSPLQWNDWWVYLKNRHNLLNLHMNDTHQSHVARQYVLLQFLEQNITYTKYWAQCL